MPNITTNHAITYTNSFACPYLVLECYQRQFADHRPNEGRKQKKITNKSAIVFEKCNHNNKVLKF